MDDASVGAVLDQLRPRLDDPLIALAARTIRRLTECVGHLERELEISELSRYAHAVEIDRMRDHRQTFAEMRAKKAGRQ